MFFISKHFLKTVCFLLELLLQRAWEFWNVKQDEKRAIFYQTISFCLENKHASQHGDIFSYLEQLKSELTYQGGLEKPVYNYSNFNDSTSYLDEINATCLHQFPKEWTVIQLCKNFNPVTFSSTFDEIVQYNTGISMTIFKHAAVSEPMMLEIKKQTDNVFEKTYSFDKKIRDVLNYSRMPQDTTVEIQESKEKYWKATKDVEVYVQEMVTQLKNFIGPWMVALTGNFRNPKSLEIENEIRRKTTEFIAKRTFQEQEIKLIHILARRTDLLTDQQIFIAIAYILRNKANLGYSDIDLNDLYDLLTWIKQEYEYEDASTYPCILIVDDLLDQLPFEMLNTQQEFSRVCSFSNLKRLFERHSGSMEGGSVKSEIKNCCAIVNPDGSLTDMAGRMKKFYDYWLPKWKVHASQQPSREELVESLLNSDALAYSGHGSGLSVLSFDSVYDLKTKAVVFLFGCASVALASSGLFSSFKGAHTYYHMGFSPAVVGFLWTVTDFHADNCSTKVCVNSLIKAPI